MENLSFLGVLILKHLPVIVYLVLSEVVAAEAETVVGATLEASGESLAYHSETLRENYNHLTCEISFLYCF